MLVPYNRKNHSVYNPFQDFDDLERAFFSDRSLGELKTDIKDTGDSYTLEADLPGFKKEDIKVDIDDDILVIKAEHSEDKDEKNDNGDYIRRERYYGSYTRSFNVSEINVDGITASYENGVLTLTMPKKVPVKPESKHLEIM